MGEGQVRSRLRVSRAAALVTFGAALQVGGSAGAGELGHYSPALPDVRDLLMPAKPGFYFKEYDYYYTSSTFRDRNGNKVSSVTINPGGGPGVTLGVYGGSFGRRAIEADANDPEGYILLAAGLQDLGRWKESRDVFVKCVRESNGKMNTECVYFATRSK